MNKKSPFRNLWIILGFLCLCLGTIGVLLPILPTVPFFMATVVCFAKSSRKLHDWFVETKLYKKHLDSFVREISFPAFLQSPGSGDFVCLPFFCKF